jgi:hypothetical protein
MAGPSQGNFAIDMPYALPTGRVKGQVDVYVNLPRADG